MHAAVAARRLPQPESSRRARSASGVTPCVSGGKRRFSAESGERPAIRCWQELGRAALAQVLSACQLPYTSSHVRRLHRQSVTRMEIHSSASNSVADTYTYFSSSPDGRRALGLA